ncbi:MAG: type II toxin-antitoxin system HicA family toxin [Actinomycetota bacterium]
MTRLPRISGKEVLSTLQRHGFSVVHVRGSHHYLRKEDFPTLVVVPVHGSSVIPPGTLKSILNQAQLTTSEFEEMLRD